MYISQTPPGIPFAYAFLMEATWKPVIGQRSTALKTKACFCTVPWLLWLSLWLLPELVAEPAPGQGAGSRRVKREGREPDPLWFPVLRCEDHMQQQQPQIPSWNGDQQSWQDYVRRVRLAWMQTPEKKKNLLGAALAARLSGRAWEISSELDPLVLQSRDGPVKLLNFLESKMAKTPVPDLGIRLEEMFLRLRRTPGSSMSQWATEVREHYKRLQRAIARARAGRPGKPSSAASPRAKQGSSSAASRHGSPSRRRSSTTLEPEPNLDFGDLGHDGGEPGLRDDPDRDVPGRMLQRLLLVTIRLPVPGVPRTGNSGTEEDGNRPRLDDAHGMTLMMTMDEMNFYLNPNGSSSSTRTLRCFPQRSWAGCSFVDLVCLDTRVLQFCPRLATVWNSTWWRRL